MASNYKYHNGQNNPNGYQGDHFKGYSGQELENSFNEDEINFKKLFYTLWNQKWIIVGAIILCGFLAGLLAFSMIPTYTSNGSLLITGSKSQQTSLGGEGLGQLLNNSYGLGLGSSLGNELQVLRSRKLSNMVADSLLSQPYMINGSLYPIVFTEYPDDSVIAAHDTVASRLRKGLEFNQVDKNAEVVRISFESPSPVEVADIINITMREYINLSTNESRTSAQSAVSFLKNEQERIEKSLYESEERLREFMNSSNLVQVDAQTQELINHISQLESLRQEAKAKLNAAESGIAQYENQLNNIRPGLADQYADAVGPNLNRLQYQLAELQIQKTQLLTNNPGLKNNTTPALKELNRKIEEYQNKIRSLTNGVLKGSDEYIGLLGGEGVANSINELNNNLIQLRVQQNQYDAQVNILTDQINKQETFFDNLPDNIIDFARLKRDVKINEELYATVSQQYAETALLEQTQFGNGRIIDVGFIPKNPSKPYTLLFILVGLILGGILGAGYVLIKEGFNEKIDGVEKLHAYSIQVLSVIPQMDEYLNNEERSKETITIDGKEISSGLITLVNSISPVSESYRRLANNIIYSNPDVNLNSIMLTSSGKGEGKTTTCANLGVILAEAGYKTLIVDTDLRRPNLHNMFGTRRSPGIVETVFDDVETNDAISDTVVPGLFIMPAGRKAPNPSALTQSSTFLNMLSELESHFDIVLIDTPPFGIITDSSALVRQVDGVAVIVRFNKTTETQLNQTLMQLRSIHAKILGTILTAFDYKKSNDLKYGSSFYSKVYKEYSEYQG